MVPATRPIICLTDRSRVGELSCPRKYFWATMFVAFCDHDFGNSTSSWRKEPTAAVRDSHSTVSNGCTPGRVNRRRTLRAAAGRAVWVSVDCGVVCSMVLAISLGTVWGSAPQVNLWVRGTAAPDETWAADYAPRLGRNGGGGAGAARRRSPKRNPCKAQPWEAGESASILSDGRPAPVRETPGVSALT